MASDYVDDFLRDERESFKRKETAAKKFDSRLDNFRKSAQALRDAARQFEEAFPGMSRTMIADKLAMTGTEKNIAFDAKGELVAPPAGRKPRPSIRHRPRPNRKRKGRRAGSGNDRIRHAGGRRDRPAGGRSRTRHLGRRTARMGVRQLLMIGRDARCD
ncbi:MAG: gas vesicle protein [Bifidobacterium adolescentis]